MNNKTVTITTVIILIALITIHLSIGLSLWYYVLLLFVFTGIKAYGSVTLSASFFINTKCKGTIQSGAVAITFDDGPLPGMTDRILSILNTYQIRATFFCIGNRVVKNPELLQKIHEQDHLVGNHSFLHGNLFSLQSAEKINDELRLTDAIIEKTIQVKPRFFRPPYGVTNPNVAKAIRKGNYMTTGWSIRSMDTVIRNEEKLFQSVTKNLQAGDVILFHDFSETTIAILPRVIDYIIKRGLKVARLDELLNEKPYA